MPMKRKASLQRNMLDPHQPLLAEQENELIAEERYRALEERYRAESNARFLRRIQEAAQLARERLQNKNAPKAKDPL